MPKTYDLSAMSPVQLLRLYRRFYARLTGAYGSQAYDTHTMPDRFRDIYRAIECHYNRIAHD